MQLARIALHIAAPSPANRPRTCTHSAYAREILAHAGLFYEEVDRDQLSLFPSPPRGGAGGEVLLLAGDAALTPDEATALEPWIESGGCLIGIGAHSGAPGLFGVREDKSEHVQGWGVGTATLGEGYGQVTALEHPVTRGLQSSLHVFNGAAVRAEGAETLVAVLDAHGRPTERALVTERRLGAGRAILLALDLAGSVVLIQQGRFVDQDGIPAPDAGGGLSDGMLKADDGMVLDWHLDRAEILGLPTPGFLHPVADELRELLIRSILHAAQQSGCTLPMLWYYPRNLPALGHLSHDTDGHDAALGRRLLGVLGELDVRGTYCVIMPGYPRELYDAIQAAGHEIALHFDALEGKTAADGVPSPESQGLHPDASFTESNLREQYAWLKKASGVAPVSNKNHYTRWEGRLQFFEWCERAGIQAEQSRGPSKLGCTGFPFGTAHPYFPIRDDGAPIDVVQVGFQSQDLVIFAPPPVGHALVDQCVTHNGIVHLIFHPAHIAKPGVADALRDLVTYARRQGIEWWTSEQINAWERARRGVRCSVLGVGEGRFGPNTQHPTPDTLRLSASSPLPGAMLLFLNAPVELRLNGTAAETLRVERYGFSFTAVLADLDPEQSLEVSWGS
jgi:hypothetical protein